MPEAKQVIVMRTDLNMRKGKMIAQGAHASMAWLTNRLRKSLHGDREAKMFFVDDEVDFTEAEYEWLEGSFTKICARVDSKEELDSLQIAALEAGLTTYKITDAGRTEFNGVPTDTCLAIGPNWAEDIDKVTGELKLL